MHDGLLNLAKPRGPTSYQVVASVRRQTGLRRVGHAGTLDPLAEGVLPIALGRATRLVAALSGVPKTYHVEIQLGTATTTDDAEGQVIGEWPVRALSPGEIEAATSAFVGEIEQLPPAHSAIKLRGKRAYQLARAGLEPPLLPRRVQVHEIKVLRWESPRLILVVRCSGGTYMRSIARDLGRQLSGGGFVRRLVRVAVGRFHLRWAISLAELERMIRTNGLSEALCQPDVALLDYPAIVVGPERAGNFKQGRPWPFAGMLESAPVGWVRAYTADGALLGVVQADLNRGVWRPSLSFVI